MNSALYPCMSVNVGIHYGLADIENGQWILVERLQATINTDWPQKTLRSTTFLLEGVAISLVVPGAREKEVLRPETKRLLTRSK